MPDAGKDGVPRRGRANLAGYFSTRSSKGRAVYTLVRNLRVRDGLLLEAPAFALSLGLAEAFYKFHSFSLECISFLVTWLALSSLFSLGARLVIGRSKTVTESSDNGRRLLDARDARASDR